MCVDPGDGTGTYATLLACTNSGCGNVSYNCNSGVCSDPGDGSGTFSTIEDCWASCPRYNCVAGVCNVNLDGTGTYATLELCEAACICSGQCSYTCSAGVWMLASHNCSQACRNCAGSLPGECSESDVTTVACQAKSHGASLPRPMPMYWLVGPDTDRTLIAVPDTFTEEDMREYGYENPKGPCSNPDDCFDEAIEEIE